jgi:hypothetical protein
VRPKQAKNSRPFVAFYACPQKSYLLKFITLINKLLKISCPQKKSQKPIQPTCILLIFAAIFNFYLSIIPAKEKSMKKAFCLSILFMFVANSCDVFKTEVFRSFVYEYYNAESVFIYETSDRNIAMAFSDRQTVCNWQSKGEQKKLYDSLCTAHNDLTYNKEVTYYESPDPELPALSLNSIASIEVSSNADFDHEHPAGTPLNDIIRFMGKSVYEFLQSNYTNKYDWENIPEEYRKERTFRGAFYEFPRYKLLSELTPEDMRMQTTDFGVLHFEKEPTLSKTHELTITITLDNNREITVYTKDNAGNKLSAIKKIFE